MLQWGKVKMSNKCHKKRKGVKNPRCPLKADPWERNRPGTKGVVSEKKEREGNKMFSISPGAKQLFLWCELGLSGHPPAQCREEGKEQRAAPLPADRTHPKAQGPTSTSTVQLGLGALHQGGHLPQATRGLRKQLSPQLSFPGETTTGATQHQIGGKHLLPEHPA